MWKCSIRIPTRIRILRTTIWGGNVLMGEWSEKLSDLMCAAVWPNMDLDNFCAHDWPSSSPLPDLSPCYSRRLSWFASVKSNWCLYPWTDSELDCQQRSSSIPRIQPWMHQQQLKVYTRFITITWNFTTVRNSYTVVRVDSVNATTKILYWSVRMRSSLHLLIWPAYQPHLFDVACPIVYIYQPSVTRPFTNHPVTQPVSN